MTSRVLDVAAFIVRVWTLAYTWRLPETFRAARLAEIESDLWEFRNESRQDVRAALHVLFRLLLGIPDDVQWRIAHASLGGKSAALVLAAMAVIALLMFVDLARARRLPVPPAPTPVLSPVRSPLPVPSLAR